MEIFFEIFGEAFISLSEAFLPHKKLSEKAQKVIRMVAALISGILFLGIIIGIAVIIESKGKNFWGWLPIVLSVIYIIFGILLNLKKG